MVCRCMMGVARKQKIDARLLDRIERKFLPANGTLEFLADGNCKKRVMGNKDADRARVRTGESFTNELDLAFADPPVLESERPRRIDPENCNARQRDKGTQGLVDVTSVAREW